MHDHLFFLFVTIKIFNCTFNCLFVKDGTDDRRVRDKGTSEQGYKLIQVNDKGAQLTEETQGDKGSSGGQGQVDKGNKDKWTRQGQKKEKGR